MHRSISRLSCNPNSLRWTRGISRSKPLYCEDPSVEDHYPSLEVEICARDLMYEDGDELTLKLIAQEGQLLGHVALGDFLDLDFAPLRKSWSCETVEVQGDIVDLQYRLEPDSKEIHWWDWDWITEPLCQAGWSPDCFVGPELSSHPGGEMNRGDLTVRTRIDSDTREWRWRRSRDAGRSEGTIRVRASCDTEPEATIAAVHDSVLEGKEAEFTVTFVPALKSDIELSYRVSQTGNYVSSTHLGNQTLAVPGGTSTVTLTVPTEDDQNIEADGTVQVALVAGTGYNVGALSRAEVTIASDDADNSGTARLVGAQIACTRTNYSNDPRHPWSVFNVEVSVEVVGSHRRQEVAVWGETEDGGGLRGQPSLDCGSWIPTLGRYCHWDKRAGATPTLLQYKFGIIRVDDFNIGRISFHVKAYVRGEIVTETLLVLRADPRECPQLDLETDSFRPEQQ